MKKTGASFFPELQTGPGQGAQVYAYVADGLLNTEGAAMYDDVANAGAAFGDADPASANSYQSAANVSACETCHGKPYMKHGYRMAHVTNGANPGLTDFSGCKDCHASDASGHGSMAGFLFEHDLNYLIANGTTDQIKADATARLAQYDTDGVLTQAETDKYSAAKNAIQMPQQAIYKMTLINDVHISHATDFPYPQHMNSCVTCHKGKMGDAALNDVFADAKFKPSNCITCHGVEGLKGKMAAANYNHAGFISQMDDPATRDSVSCRNCHASGDVQADTGTAGVNGGGTPFATIHNNGYDPLIYASDGTRYAADCSDDPTTTCTNPGVFAVKITEATYDADHHTLDIKFSATGVKGSMDAKNIKPTVTIGLYGYDTKDFIVAAHGSAADGKRNLEHVFGSTTDNPRYTDVTYTGNGSWETTVDLSLWATMLDSADPSNPAVKPVIRRAEIAVLPELRDASNNVIGLNAPSRTFNFADDEFETTTTRLSSMCSRRQTAIPTSHGMQAAKVPRMAATPAMTSWPPRSIAESGAATSRSAASATRSRMAVRTSKRNRGRSTPTCMPSTPSRHSTIPTNSRTSTRMTLWR